MMKQGKGWSWPLIITGAAPFVVLCSLLGCTLFLFFGSTISFPPTETLAQRYLEAVINEDLEAAASLAGSGKGCGGGASLRDDAWKDIAIYGGTEVRNVRIEVHFNTGSDESLEFAIVEFEYCRPGQSVWHRGEMRLMTDHKTLGFRYLCSNLKYQGP
jgi:hypothetical protein